MVLLDGFFPANPRQKTLPSAAIPRIIVKVNIAQKHLHVRFHKYTVHQNLVAVRLSRAHVNQVCRAGIVAHRFEAFACFFADEFEGFFGFYCAVGSAAENNCNLFVFYACAVEFR